MSLWNRAAVAAATAVVLAATGVGVGAQSIKEGDLANITALKCTFPVSTRVVWNKDGVPEPAIKTTGVLTVEINEIDAADGSAIVGTVSTGNHDVNVQVYGWNMHFLEASRGGRIAVTTVFAQYSTGTKLKAVHTRTDYLPIDLPGFKSEPEVAQYYGDCDATR
jgi:hypothetical protein